MWLLINLGTLVSLIQRPVRLTVCSECELGELAGKYNSKIRSYWLRSLMLRCTALDPYCFTTYLKSSERRCWKNHWVRKVDEDREHQSAMAIRFSENNCNSS